MDGTNEDEDGRDSDEEIDADEPQLVNIANTVSASLARSTKTAIKHLDKYLDYLHQIDSNANPYTSYSKESIPLEYFTKDLIGKFADYLMKIKKIKRLETTNGYISKVKGKLALDYDPLILPFLASSTFYTKLRLTVTSFYVTKCAHTGENLSDKAPPMTFDDLQIINDILIRNNTPDSNESRCLLTHQWQVNNDIGSHALIFIYISHALIFIYYFSI
jgi:hypothetical protein